MVQLPPPVSVTTFPAIVQLPVAVKPTGSPDEADAFTANDASP